MLALVLTQDGKLGDQVERANAQSGILRGAFDVFYLSTSIVPLPLPLAKHGSQSPEKNKLTCLNLLFRLSFMLKLNCLQRQRALAKVGKAWTFIFGRSLFIFLNIVILCTVIIDVGLVIEFDSCHVLCT